MEPFILSIYLGMDQGWGPPHIPPKVKYVNIGKHHSFHASKKYKWVKCFSLCVLYSWYANGRKVQKNTPRQKLANFNVHESILILNAEPSPSNLLTAKKDLPSQILKCSGKGGINLLQWSYSPLYWKLFIHPEGSGTETFKDLFPIFSSWNNPLLFTELFIRPLKATW